MWRYDTPRFTKYLDPAKCNYLDYIDIQTGSGGGRLTGL